jgi:hypothetical protein
MLMGAGGKKQKNKKTKKNKKNMGTKLQPSPSNTHPRKAPHKST